MWGSACRSWFFLSTTCVPVIELNITNNFTCSVILLAPLCLFLKLFFKGLFYFLLCVCVCTCKCSTYEGQKRALHPLELEL